MGRFNMLRKGGGTGFSPMINRSSIGKGGVGFRGDEMAGGYGSDRTSEPYIARRAMDFWAFCKRASGR